LNGDVGELPAGRYDIEIDEEEIPTQGRSASRRIAIYFYVEQRGSTRTFVIHPSDLDSALRRDAENRTGIAFAEIEPAALADETYR
jgi:hypothetical protein